MSDSSLDKKMLAAALQRLETLQKQSAFDPQNLESVATPAQQEVIDDFGKVQQIWLRAGNQCFPEYSQVLMADGTSRNISNVNAGDMVMAFDYKKQTGVPTKVLKRWDNGNKDVYRYRFKKHEYLDSTPNHQVLYNSGTGFGKRPIGSAREIVIAPCITEGKPIDVPHNGIELLGFLLGDGYL